MGALGVAVAPAVGAAGGGVGAGWRVTAEGIGGTGSGPNAAPVDAAATCAGTGAEGRAAMGRSGNRMGAGRAAAAVDDGGASGDGVLLGATGVGMGPVRGATDAFGVAWGTGAVATSGDCADGRAGPETDGSVEAAGVGAASFDDGHHSAARPVTHNSANQTITPVRERHQGAVGGCPWACGVTSAVVAPARSPRSASARFSASRM
jgi:hypothetical protein